MEGDADDPPTNVPLERWRRGDEAAFGEMFARFRPTLLAWIRAHAAWPFASKHCEADDLLQEVWMRALPAAKSTFENRGKGAFLAFLRPIVDGAVSDAARRMSAQKRGGGAVAPLATNYDAPDAAGPGRAAPETPTGFARRNELAKRARELCNDDQYRAWDLVDLQGCSFDEAAAAMGRTPAAVRGLVHRARTRIALDLEDDPNAEPRHGD
jgi:RNA polymerase sigma factor (sigma-70 family)